MEKITTMDSGLGFLTGQLASVESKLYEIALPQINYADFIPVSTAAGEWATSIEYYTLSGAGVAKWIGSRAFDVPLASLESTKTVVGVELAGTGYDYSLEELRQAQHLNRPLSNLKANAARRAYEEMAQRVAMNGDTVKGFTGFINNPNVTVDAGGIAIDGTSTGDDIIDMINGVLNGIFEDTNMVEYPDMIALPVKQWGYLNSTPRSANSDTTLLQYLVSNSPYLASVDSVKPLNELKGAGLAGVDRMVVYAKNSDKLEFHIPMPLRFVAPQPKGLGFIVAGEFKLGGVEVRYPASMRYVDGI